MTAAFPSWITFNALQASYGEVRESNWSEFQPDIGPPKRRRRSTNAQTVMQVQGYLSSDDFGDLDQFFRSTMNQGADEFTWTHPRTGAAGTFKFEGDPPAIIEVRSGAFLVSFSIRQVA